MIDKTFLPGSGVWRVVVCWHEDGMRERAHDPSPPEEPLRFYIPGPELMTNSMSVDG